MKVLIFGATGAAGKSVLRACLNDTSMVEVRALTRRPPQSTHPKLRIVIHQNYLHYAGVETVFTGIDACFFCLGVSSLQVSEETEYRKITHDFAIAAAQVLKARSPHAAFHFISGRGTRIDGGSMWARIKGETERDLKALIGANCWRPAFIDGEPSDSWPKLFYILQPLFRLLKPFRNLYVSGRELGCAMIQATRENMRERVVENAEIRDIAKRYGK